MAQKTLCSRIKSWIISSLLSLLVLNLHRVDANWMYLGVASVGLSVNRDDGHACALLPGLVVQQRTVCQQNPDAMPCVSIGARLGIKECHFQFKDERWNCTTVHNQSVFGPVLGKGTKESAFIYAVTSAGVVHAVTQSCGEGNLTDCSCDMSLVGKTPDSQQVGFTWGGCSDNVDYGVWFAKNFVDASDRQTASPQGLKEMVNLHNNKVGREVIKNLMRVKCRCHGVSGSCTLKSCWRKMPTFREVGDHLKAKYESSAEVAPRSKRKLRYRKKKWRKIPIDENQLVYIERSPNYCRPDSRKGIVGTRGRECKRRTKGPNSCNTLCCGRGYNTQVVRYIERCHCKFVWCCYVKCKTCETVVDKHTCK